MRGDDSEGCDLKQAALSLARTAVAQNDEVEDWLRHSEIVPTAPLCWIPWMISNAKDRAAAVSKLQTWLEKAEIVPVNANQTADFHARFDDHYAFRSATPLVIEGTVGNRSDSISADKSLWMGVNTHPWAWVANEFRQNLILNSAEISAISKLRSQFPDSAPFPDSARFPPEKLHADAFAKYLLNGALGPGAFDLRYVRYLVDASIERRIKL